MRHHIIKLLVLGAAGLSLAACNTMSGAPSAISSASGAPDARATLAPPAASADTTETTGSIAQRSRAEAPAPVPEAAPATQALPSKDGKDDIAAGREHFRAGRFAEAEGAFDRAAKLNPREAEAWLGLAACYDRMRRFELADRAYVQAMAIKGPTSEILNNQGYSYLLRGDTKRARNTLTAAKNKDPDNAYVQNNLQLLDQTERKSAAK